MLNSYVIYKKVKPDLVEFLCCRLNVVRHLLKGKYFQGRPDQVPTRPLADVDPKRLNGEYHFVAIEDNRGDGVVCSKIVSVQDFCKNFQNKTNAVCHPCQMAHNLPPLPHAVLFLPHSNHWRQRLFLGIQRCSGKKEKGKASGACILPKLILQKA